MDNVVSIVLVGVWLITIVLAYIIGMDDTIKRLRNKKTISKDDVLACFAEVNWKVYSFSSNGHMFKDRNGHTKFYSVVSIDNAIEKLIDLFED